MKKKILIIVGIIFLTFVLLIGYFTMHDLQVEKKLKNEINDLSKLDITKDRFNTSIKTTGDYAIIEKSIKEYLDNYAVSVQNVTKLLEDSKLTNLLTASNYSSDGPDFVDSLNYIQTTTKSFNKEIDNLIVSCNEKAIMEYIEDKKLDDYYVDLYKELMFTDDMTKEFSDSRILLQDSKDTINNLFTVSTDVINYLISIKGSWKIQDNKILFQTDDMVNTYNNLISKLSK